MKKIGITTRGSFIIEMDEAEYKRLVLLPPATERGRDLKALDAIKEANARKELSDYNFRTLSRVFEVGGQFHGCSVSEMLVKIAASAPKYHLTDRRGLSPRVVKKLLDVLEKSKIA